MNRELMNELNRDAPNNLGGVPHGSVRRWDEFAGIACVNYVRHTPARGLSSANVRDPKRTTATVDRLLHHAHICQTSGESVRLSQALAGQGV